MKKIAFLLLLCLAFSLCLSSCVDISAILNSGEENNEDGNEKNPDLTAEYVYQLAKNEGYTGTLEQFIAEFKGEAGADGKDGVGISVAAFNEEGHLILTLTNGKTLDCGKITINVTSSSSTSISIGTNGNWYINGEDTGKRAEATDGTVWHTGSGAPISALGNDGDLYLDTKSSDVYKKNLGVWSVIANIAGDGKTVYEGDNYDVTVNADSSSMRFAAAKSLMSAVRVESLFEGSLGQYIQVSNGAGVIYKLDKDAGDAYIITNYHVVYDADAITSNKIADEINVYLYGMEYSDYKISCEYVGGAMTYDIAVLKVKGNELIKTSAVAAAEVADSEAVEVLDTAIAVGNPASSGLSATLGSVSVKSEYLEILAPDNETMVEYRVMRIDTPVNSGNSGGGLFNAEGKLIGIVNAKEGDTSLENMGYAIPSNLAVYVTENIIRNCDGKPNEQVIKCRIGMMIAVSDIKSEYDAENGVIKVTETCAITEFETGSIAEVMLMVGDVIKSFEIDGVTYEVKHNYDGGEILLNANLSSVIYINVERNGAPMRFRLNTTAQNFVKVQ